jgi:aminoglycoside phosphotransferase (APT) family kinase protein
MRVHDDELEIDEPLVRALVAEQFPQWAGLPLARGGDGTVNVIYRLGDELAVRLPRRAPGDEGADDILRTIGRHVVDVQVPRPVARGRPGTGYPWAWSIHTWLEGEHPTGPVDPVLLAGLLRVLWQIDSAGGPAPAGGRGRPLRERDSYVRDALERVHAPGALALWERATAAAEWPHRPVWLHADLDARNVLVREERLAGVLDWDGAGVGDPAVDVMVAWKLVAADERERFRALLGLDDATWLRAQGWCVSQALIALGYYTSETNPPIFREATRWLAAVLDG